MNTIQLKYALEIEKTGSITAAAHNLYLSQPNLTKSIKALEEEVNIQIFRRTPKGMTPTREGKEFLSHARVIYEQMANFDAKYTSKEVDGVNMTICIPHATYMSVAISEFLTKVADSEKIMMSINEGSPLSTLKAIVSGAAHLGIVRYYDKHENYLFDVLEQRGVEFVHLLEFEPNIVMSKRHPLANKEKIFLEDLIEYIEIIHGDNEEMRRELGISSISAFQIEPQKKIYLSTRGSQGDILANVPGTYMWVSNMPERILKAGNLVIRKCENQNRIAKDILVYRRGHMFSKYETMLCECIKEKIKEMYGGSKKVD